MPEVLSVLGFAEWQGCKTIRFWNKEVTGNIERVILAVMNVPVEYCILRQRALRCRLHER
jgi:very-short-patch-repair endonuclease